MSASTVFDLCDCNKHEEFMSLIKSPRWSEAISLNNYVRVKYIENSIHSYLSSKSTLLCVASEYASVEFVDELLRQGAQADITDGFGDSPLHKACRSSIDTMQKVQLLIDKNCQLLYSENKNGITPLHIAASKRNPEVCAHILKFSVDINAISNKFLTPLHIASHFGNVQVVKTLLSCKGIDVNSQDLQGDTPLHHASNKFNGAVITLLKQHPLCFCHLTNRGGRTADQEYPINIALLYNSQAGSLKVVQWLLGYGAMCVTDQYGDNPLHKACRSDVDAFAKVQLLYTVERTQVLQSNKRSEYPIHLAARHADSRILQYLITKSLVYMKTIKGQNVLHIAAQSNQQTKIKFLLTDTDIAINEQDFDGNTAAHYAASNGYQEILQLIANHPCYDPSIVNKDGKTADDENPINVVLLQMSSYAPVTQVEQILNTGAKLLTDQNDNTLLHIACGSYVDGVDKCKLFIKADHRLVNTKNLKGDTPLHVAVRNSDTTITRYLLSVSDIEVNAQNKDQQTPLHLCAIRNSVENMQLILSHPNININIRDHMIDTACHIAISYERHFMASLLMSCPSFDESVEDRNGLTVAKIIARDAVVHRGMIIEASKSDQQHLLNVLLSHEYMPTDLHSLHDVSFYISGRHYHCLLALLRVDIVNADVIDAQGNTILHLIAGDVELDISNESVSQLIQECLPYVNQRNHDKDSLMHLAITRGSLSLLDLLARHTQTNVNIRNAKGDTPLMTAIQVACLQSIEIIMRNHDVDTSCYNDNNSTVLHLICQTPALCNMPAPVQMLMKESVNCGRGNTINLEGNTPLHIAIQIGSTALVEYLAKEVNVNTCNEEGYYPLHLAVQRKCRHSVRALLDNTKLQIKSQDKAGNTALHLAIGTKTFHELMTYPCIHHVINSPNKAGKKPLMIAVERRDEICIDKLMQTTGIEITMKDRYEHTVAILGSEPTPLLQKLYSYPKYIRNVDEEYKMNAETSGYALMINICKDRKGSAVDEQNMTNVFTSLHFKVITEGLKDCTKKQIMKTLEDIKNEKQDGKSVLSRHDCLVVIIMAHGNEGKFKDIDGKRVYLDDIVEMFNGDNCEDLVNKPKLFFVQVCRGVFEDNGKTTSLEKHMNSVADASGSQEVTQQRDYSATDDKCRCWNVETPSYLDMLISHATWPDHISYRNTHQGSLYINALCKVLQEKKETHHILDILTQVTKCVAKDPTLRNVPTFKKGEKEQNLQTPVFHSSLSKLLYFSPVTPLAK